MPLVGVTSNTVPWELLRAAGLHPVLLSPRRRHTPLADRYMEDVFSARMKAIFDFLISAESCVAQRGGDSQNLRAGAQTLSLFARGGSPG